jgi:hypothetical protein
MVGFVRKEKKILVGLHEKISGRHYGWILLLKKKFWLDFMKKKISGKHHDGFIFDFMFDILVEKKFW